MLKNSMCLMLIALLLIMLCGCSAKNETVMPENDKIVVTIGGLFLEGSPIQGAATMFNRSQDEVEVQILDYNPEHDHLEDAGRKLKTELLAGGGPDLLYFSYGSLEEHNPVTYIGKNFLLDLDPFLEQDPDLSKEDLYIWEALHEYGEMYLLTSMFSVETLCCLQSFYEEHQGWTVAEYLECEKTMDPDQALTYYMTPENFIERVGALYLPHALDLEHATCDFDNPEFISLLYGAWKGGQYNVGYTGETVLKMMQKGTLMTYYSRLRTPLTVTQDREGTDAAIEYVGWPTPDGSVGMHIAINCALGISALSEHPEACWEFLKYYVKHPALTTFLPDGAPLYRPKMDECIAFQNQRKTGYQAEEQDIRVFVEVASRCDSLGYYDTTVMKLIQEELKAMLEGTASPEETAKNIQARASLYMQEQYG